MRKMDDQNVTDITGSVHGDNQTTIDKLEIDNVNINIDSSIDLPQLERIVDKFAIAIKESNKPVELIHKIFTMVKGE